MKWIDGAFCDRVKARAEQLGLTIAQAMDRCGLTEDYLRRKPDKGRNIAAVLQIAEGLDMDPAELMGLVQPSPRRRTMIRIAHIVTCHINLMRANGGGTVDVEHVVAAALAELKQPTLKPRSPKAAKPKPLA